MYASKQVDPLVNVAIQGIKSLFNASARLKMLSSPVLLNVMYMVGLQPHFKKQLVFKDRKVVLFFFPKYSRKVKD